jgi:hypothetical protein
MLLDGMLGGAIHEKFNNELSIVAANIQDPNTSAKAKREITIKLTISPDEDRTLGEYEVSVYSKLCPAKSIKGKMVFGLNSENEGEASEFNAEMLGQMSIDDALADDGESDTDERKSNVVDLRRKKAN